VLRRNLYNGIEIEAFSRLEVAGPLRWASGAYADMTATLKCEEENGHAMPRTSPS
jgi:hypothetical protein